MSEMIFLPKNELLQAIRDAIDEKFDSVEKKRRITESPTLLTVTVVAKRLGRSYTTIKKLCNNGIIKTTKDGLIEESEIEKYLSNT